MGLLDVLTGRRKLAPPAPDRLFAITTAYVTLETSLAITTRGTAAIVFQSLATADFRTIVTDAEAVVRATAERQRHRCGDLRRTTTASAGSCCARDRRGSFDDLVVGLNAVSTALEAGGYGDRVLCAVFAFSDDRGRAALPDLQLQARLLLPLRARGRGGEGGATPSASSCSRRSSAQSSRSSPS